MTAVANRRPPKLNGLIPLLIGLLILCVVMCSCKTKYAPVEIKTTITETVRDTTVRIKLVPYKDSVAVQADSSYLHNVYAYSWARINANGVLSHSLGIFPQAAVEAKIMFIDKLVTTEVPVIKEVPVEVEKKLNGWQRFIMGCGYVLLVGVVVTIFIWIRKFIGLKIVD